MLIDLQWILLGGGALAAGGIVWAVRAAERRRREALEQHCLVRGFQFDTERPDGERRLGTFELFNAGRRRRWGYTIAGRLRDMPFTAFEYSWVTGSGKHSQTHRISAIVWERENGALTHFELTPEGWLTRIGAVFGMQDIDFTESPEFSKAYRLKGPDEAAIRKLFTPVVREFFAATPGQQVAGGGRLLLWWKDGRLPKPEALDEWLEQGDLVRRRFFP